MTSKTTTPDDGWDKLLAAALAYSRAVCTADFPSQSVILRSHTPDLLLLATSHLLYSFAAKGPLEDPRDPGLRLLLIADLLIHGADEKGGPLTAWTARDQQAAGVPPLQPSGPLLEQVTVPEPTRRLRPAATWTRLNLCAAGLNLVLGAAVLTALVVTR